MKFIRILLVEDTNVELDEITGGFINASVDVGADCKIVRAGSKIAATELSDKFLYHLISLDQNIPLEDDPNASTVLGFELAEELARKKRCFHGTIYTNVPEKDKMVSLMNTGFQYREKSVLTDVKNNCFTPEDYTVLTFSEAVAKYPESVFDKLRNGGFGYISGYAGSLHTSYVDLEDRKTDGACKEFYTHFFPFFERSLLLASAVFSNLADNLGVEVDALPTYRRTGSPNVAAVIDWMGDTFRRMRGGGGSRAFLDFEAYFCDGSQHSNLEEFFIASCRDFKDFRNEKVHNSFAISLDEHAQVLPMVFRILDVMSAIATSNVIYQPRRLGRSWIVDGTLLNDRFPSTQQIEVSEDEFGIVGGENFPTEGVLMSLPLVGFFKLNNHFCVTRDEATRTSKLEFKPWFRD